jgi:hypothetical protein
VRILPTTTIGSLEVHLRANAATCFVELLPDGRYFAVITDHEFSGDAFGSSLDEAIDSAFISFNQTKFGPKPTKEQLS